MAYFKMIIETHKDIYVYNKINETFKIHYMPFFTRDMDLEASLIKSLVYCSAVSYF